MYTLAKMYRSYVHMLCVHKEVPDVYTMLYLHLFEESLQIEGNLTRFFFINVWTPGKRLQEVYVNIPTLYILLFYVLFFGL